MRYMLSLLAYDVGVCPAPVTPSNQLIMSPFHMWSVHLGPQVAEHFDLTPTDAPCGTAPNLLPL